MLMCFSGAKNIAFISLIYQFFTTFNYLKTSIMNTNSITFEKKWFDRAIPLRFKVNYWFLKQFGLFGFGLFAFFWGVVVTLFILYILK